MVNASAHLHHCRCTYCRQAPELLMNKACSLKVDMYSMGVILWELCTGQVPIRGQMRNIRYDGARAHSA